jgi:hypothetical protein
MKNLDKWLHALAAMGIFLVAAFVSHYWMIGVAIAMGAGLMNPELLEQGE